ncbi:hypothetical protein pb186bvf_005158 [Paramecium bursaria]
MIKPFSFINKQFLLGLIQVNVKNTHNQNKICEVSGKYKYGFLNIRYYESQKCSSIKFQCKLEDNSGIQIIKIIQIYQMGSCINIAQLICSQFQLNLSGNEIKKISLYQLK